MLCFNFFTNDVELAAFLELTFHDLHIPVDYWTSRNSTDYKYVFTTNDAKVMEALLDATDLYNRSTEHILPHQKIFISIGSIVEVKS